MSQLEECITEVQRLRRGDSYSLDEIECGVLMLIAEHLAACEDRLTHMTIHLENIEGNTRA